MATINIQIAVDAATLAEQVQDQKLSPGSLNGPTGLGAYSASNVYITMTSQNGNVVDNSQGQSELTVKANSGDTIEWAINTFDNNADNTVYLYNGAFNPSDAISALTYHSAQVGNYFPPSGNPTAAPSLYTNQVTYAQADIQKLNVQIQYTLSFIVVDNASGSIIGYFSWDPFIVVNP